jgi:hypothetical protein
MIQVDDGTFMGSQPLVGRGYPVFWAHRNPGEDDETWVLFRPWDAQQGFVRIGDSLLASELEFTYLGEKDVSWSATEFRDRVIDSCVNTGMSVQASDFWTLRIGPSVTPTTPGGKGLVLPGIYEVRETNLATPTQSVAWVNRYEATSTEEVWCLSTKTGREYARPGEADPFVTMCVSLLDSTGQPDANDFQTWITNNVSGMSGGQLDTHVGKIEEI